MDAITLPYDADSDPVERYRHPLVRDLAWLCLVPDLLAMPWPGRPTLGELGLAGEDLTAFLADQEADSRALEARVGEARHARLGHYHERLWQFLLEAAPNTRLLAHNLPVQRDRRTLGELDLIYRHRDDPRPVHLEVAIKFYLGLTEGPGESRSQARWIGPGGADSLATKRERLHRHQLPLAATPEAIDALERVEGLTENGRGRAPNQRLALPGVLFYPWRECLAPPLEASGDHLRGHWLAFRDWPALRAGLDADTRGAWLDKPHWLALPSRDALLPLDEVERHLRRRFATLGPPLPLALHGAASGWRRLFVVGDDWPLRIPLPPRPTPLP